VVRVMVVVLQPNGRQWQADRETEMLIVCLLCSRLKLHRAADPLQKMDQLPGVSIVKPLMGVDPYLETNLESHFTLEYPKVQLP